MTPKKWSAPKSAYEFRREARKAWDFDKVQPLVKALEDYDRGAIEYEGLVGRLRHELMKQPETGDIVRLPARKPWWWF